MDGSRGTIGLVVALSLLASGCTSSPWSAGRTAPGAADPPVAKAASDRSMPHSGAGSPAANDPNAGELEGLMADLQQLGSLDPATRQQLIEDLGRTDPATRKPLVECLRAALASRRQAGRRGESPADARLVSPDRGPQGDDGRIGNPSYADHAKEARWDGSAPPAPRDAAGGPPQHEPAATPTRPPAGDRPGNGPGIAQPGKAGKPGSSGRREPEGKVVAAGGAPGGQAWQDHLAAAIRRLESEVSPAPKTQAEVARHVELRLLYLAAGRRDDALRPIPSVPPDTQEFWATELYGLEQWLGAERTADPSSRAAQAKRSLDEAASKLGESAPLVVRRLAFATEIQSYGCYTPFAKDEFAPDQEVLLYAEVENFKSERTPKGFHTSLRSSYKIYDSAGHQVAEHDFPLIEEVCHSRRRDFFIGYHLRLPRRVFAGRHTLRLTIEDLTKGQIGQASIEFTVKE